MTSDQALDRLNALLDAAGVDRAAPTPEDVPRTWAVMRAFAAEPVENADPVEEDGDGILAQYGTYDWGDGEHYTVDMTRQFCFSEDGEYAGMAQLQCTFECAPTDALRAVGEGNLWSFGTPLDAFFAKALALPGFAVPLVPLRLVTDYSDV